ncbi:hypothetical protein ACO0K7_07760 [Undibacterium sp. Ji67W]|uniref:hypothetical protein n=1 Tax=Undibacterium sp. Ji67W TaxID=3413042 RepID=UPI003BF0CB6B
MNNQRLKGEDAISVLSKKYNTQLPTGFNAIANVRLVPKANIDGIGTSTAMHSVVGTMAYADTVTWYLLYLRFRVGPLP